MDSATSSAGVAVRSLASRWCSARSSSVIEAAQVDTPLSPLPSMRMFTLCSLVADSSPNTRTVRPTAPAIDISIAPESLRLHSMAIMRWKAVRADGLKRVTE